MRDNKYCLAIVGFGGMGNWHRELIESGIDGLFVKGVFDLKQERLDYAKENNLVAYASREELLADEEVDIVLCATPNDVHKEVTIAALKAGKNVVCEKPVAMNSAELQEMINTANECKKLFVVHQNRRWDQDFLTMKKIFDEKLLGEVHCIESRVHGSRGIPGDWRGEVEHGGGMILDWGVHIIDQLLQMVKENIKSIYCTLDHVTNELVDDGFKIMVTFESGLRALLEVGTSNFIELPRWYMLGTNGSATIEDWYMHGKMVRITDWDKNDAVPVKTAAGLTKTMAPRTDETIKTEDLPHVDTDIKDFYRNVMATISGKADILIKHDELMRVMKFMEAAFESARTNTVVPFD
ncbi:Gfo/Idh/MocA family oxidoreductase [Paludicola sp. MB14-C6]|uniref:Gfo/Idh/MocA family protein n=1 Tax=Paludihabitans sp. MB14-C6 TaxID=3070656 RepID=UPI0027DDDBC0|nr:Gfo/Idh/MocA family oxidoreductase [Paludicola sp. MB14-C6]WMJ21968.1 Gfo/Idh/MocA family oxidoreductase [Paludicola sp. MB14-C6]